MTPNASARYAKPSATERRRTPKRSLCLGTVRCDGRSAGCCDPAPRRGEEGYDAAVVTTALTPREEAVLSAIERRLTNPEIAAEQFVSVRTVESHIASLRRKLAVDSRAGLIAAARRRHETSVPLPGNPLRGRDEDLRRLDEVLDAHRWVTITGPGGVGKTRLALEHAHASARVPILVALEHAEPGDIVARLCRALGIESLPGADAVTSLGLALPSQPYLLVLDDADRVGPAVRAVLTRLRPFAPDVRIVVTSRTPLGDPDEAVIMLDPLAAAGDGSPAAAMLLDRMAPARALTTVEKDAAAAVCARLDGLPLAIELAASVARHLSLQELAARLERDLSTLDRAAPEGRHRTLETAFEWTWDLLDDGERELLCRLAALPLSFDLELAAAVADADADAERGVLRLLDHSLIVPAGGDPARFRLLAVLREFVRGRTDPGVVGRVRRIHAQHITRLATAFAAIARTDDSASAVATSKALCGEANAALRWSLSAGDDAAVPLAGALAIGVEQFGADLDSVQSLRLAAADPRFRARSTPETLANVGSVLSYGDLSLAEELVALVLDVRGEPTDRMNAHLLAGTVAAYNGEADARTHLDEAEMLALRLGDEWRVAHARQMRGVALRTSGADPEAVLAAFASALRAYARAGDAVHVHNARYMMALTAAEAGIRRDEAAEWARDCADYAASAGNLHELAHADLVLTMLGLAPTGELHGLAERFRSLGDRRCVTRVLVLQAARVEPARAIALLEEAATLATDAGDRARMIDAYRRLVEVTWRAGDRVAALAALDRYAVACGVESAREACPRELLAEFDADQPSGERRTRAS